MASVRISHTWADGETLTVDMFAKSSFPDAVNEIRSCANKAFREAAADVAEHRTLALETAVSDADE